MSLRWRLTGAFLLVVVAAVGGGTLAHLAEVGRRLEEQLEQQAGRVVSSIETDMAQTGEVLDEEVRLALEPRGSLARGVASTRMQTRYLVARTRLQRGRLEILKMVGERGEILTSGHWPASFGALDPQLAVYQGEPGPAARIVDEATPSGSAPSLQRWARGRLGGSDVTVVAGRFLDEEALERMRARVGADVLALCRKDNEGETCLAVRAKGVLPEQVDFAPNDPAWTDTLVLRNVRLGAGTEAPRLITGLDRRAIDQVRGAMVRRAVTVGGLSIVLAMLLGVFLATRQVRPIEALSDAAGRLAEGDLSTRVEGVHGGGAETRHLVEAFNRMAADLERQQTNLKQAERVAAWREIARGLAHELKNPLTPIRGAMDVLRKARRLDRPDFDDILNEQADAVVEEVNRLKELADAFARFARLPDPKLEPLPMEQVVDNALALYVPDDGLLNVERQFEASLPAVTADRTQIATAVTNLVKNAVEAMEGKGSLIVKLRARAADKEFARPAVELVVQDSGPGISEEIRDKLFMPYVTTKGSRGTGLGLALVHRIVLEHEGAIEVGTGPGGGAAFCVRLPVSGPARRQAARGEDKA